MGPFYLTKPGTSTNRAGRRNGNFGTGNLAVATLVNGKNFNLIKRQGTDPGREPDSLSK